MTSPNTKHLATTAWNEVLQGLAEMRNSDLSAHGANVVLCCGSVKVVLHEILARRFTRIFDFFPSGNIAELRDENGVIVLIIPYVNSQSLRAMSELMYTGKALIRSEETMNDLDQLLSKELSCSVVVDTLEPKEFKESDEVKNHRLKSPYEQSFEIKEPKTTTSFDQVTIKVDYDAEEYMESCRMSDDFKNDTDECEDTTIKKELTVKLECGENGYVLHEAALKALGREPTQKEKDRLFATIGKKGETKQPYICLLCGKRTASSPTDHVRRHKGENPYKCDMCPKAYPSTSALKLHKNTNHEERQILQCDMCPKTFKRKQNLEEHIKSVHTGERPWQCKLCPRSFTMKDYLKKHIKKIHQKDPSEVSAVAARLNEQSGHIIIKDPTNNGIPDEPPDIQLDENLVKSVGRPLTQVEQNLLYVKIGSIYHSWKAIDDAIGVWSAYSEDKRGKYLCLVCGKFIDTVGVAKKHTELVHKGIKPKPNKCPQCDYHCASITTMKIHIRVHHTKEKPFQCEYCSSSFARKGQLQNHVTLHTGEQRFRCKLCPKKFATNDRLKVHMRTHTGEKPFQCHLCSAMFAAKFNLIAHVRGVHKELLYKCQFCSSGFEKKAKLDDHIALYHREEESKRADSF